MRAPAAPPVRRCLGVALLAGLVAAGCRTQLPRPAAATTVEPARLHVLVLNGGGTAAQNYRSHLLHVQHLDAMLADAGLPRDRVGILASDGADPGLDLATREEQPEPDFWLVEGSRLEAPLRTPVVLADSSVPGAVLRPATRDELQRWFTDAAARLRPGDTLLVYVTDHGTRAPKDKDRLDTAITLWGTGERLTVRELGAMLAGLDPAVRVVTVMSQCYSGGFAALASERRGGALPDGATCGYFSSTAERPAYGCYPENRGRANVGHGFHFLDALARGGRLAEAHRATVISDATPDVPLRTSDVWLEERLRRAAAGTGEDLEAFVDRQLREAWRDQAAWEPEVRLLDAIGERYGFFSPRSLAEVREQSTRLDAMAEQLKTHHEAWERALDSARRANLDRFLAEAPVWRQRVEEATLQNLEPEAARALAAEVLPALGRDTRADTAMAHRLGTLRDKTETAQTLSYRMEVRQGVLLRMRAILLGVAGRTWVAAHGSAEERRALDGLDACERLAIPAPPTTAGAGVAAPAPFPALADDVAVADVVLPAWMGIQFDAAGDERRAAAGLEAGAVTVLNVYPDSPAAAAGMQPGDVVVGPPGAPFREREQVREWTMLSRVDEPRDLEVLREGQAVRVTLVPKPMPGKWPKLPGPPKPGTPAPPLRLEPYRGTPPTELADGRPHLLFFWATWCAVCKAALPEVDAFARERATPVVAITDEGREKLDSFFTALPGPFPPLVATDANRRAFAAYGVSGLPTFVLVGADGKVVASATGYTATKGLGLDGWVWSKRPAAPPG